MLPPQHSFFADCFLALTPLPLLEPSTACHDPPNDLARVDVLKSVGTNGAVDTEHLGVNVRVML